MSLNTQIGNVKLQTPLLLASGYITETPEFFLKAQPHGCSGMVTRSLRLHVPQNELMSQRRAIQFLIRIACSTVNGETKSHGQIGGIAE